MDIDLGQGWSLWTDQDGDWWLGPPSNITIVSQPGESYLIGRCDQQTAEKDAAALRASWGL